MTAFYNSNFFKLFVNFLIGGFITATISYTANFMSPVLAAIWWAFPLSLLPSMYYLHQEGRDNKYLSTFAFVTTFALIILFFTTASLAYFYKKTSDGFWSPIAKTLVIYVILGSLYYGLIKYFNLEKRFIE